MRPIHTLLVATLGWYLPGTAWGQTGFTVTHAGAVDYLINGFPDPALTLYRGQSYAFDINASGHPFWIKTAPVTGTGGAYNEGVTGNGTTLGTLTFTVPMSAPDTLYYICQFHPSMVGTLTITNLPAEQLVIDSIDRPGQIVFDQIAGTDHYRVEWSADGGAWTTFTAAAEALDYVPSTSMGAITARVPMLYRVVAVPGTAQDLVITEIMYAPQVSDDVGEWFEVYNRGSQPVDMAGLTIETDQGEMHFIPADSTLSVSAGDYVVLGGSIDPPQNGETPVDYAYSGLLMRNIGGAIMIKDGTNLIDGVAYEPDSPFPMLEQGRSVYLLPGALDPQANDNGANWRNSTTTYGIGQFGTPGEPNEP